jgi:hypothetical protein
VVKGSISQDPRSPRHGQLPASSTTQPPPPRRGRTARGPPGSSKARPHQSIDGIKAQLTEPPSPASPPRFAAAQRGQPACHGILCRSRAPVQRDAPPQDATEQTSASAASARRSDAEHHRGTGRLPGRARRRPLFPLAPPRERGEDRANGMRRESVATLPSAIFTPTGASTESQSRAARRATFSICTSTLRTASPSNTARSARHAIFWSSWGQRHEGTVKRPMTGCGRSMGATSASPS